MSLDTEQMEFYMEDLRESQNRPCVLSNVILAKKVYRAALKEFPEAVLVETEWRQWIAATPIARMRLRRQLEEQVFRKEREIVLLREGIEKLKL